MNIQDLKKKLKSIEIRLSEEVFVYLHTFERDGTNLHLGLTERFRKACKKGKVWNRPKMLTALKNAQYGFDEKQAMSPGGSDGIFLLTRSYTPKNEMMRKLFDRYIDKPGSGAEELAAALNSDLESLLPVRLVSHHMRLLGLLHRDKSEDTLVLVDFDDTKD